MNKQSPDLAEQAFFKALTDADVGALSELLADDFLLIDVLTGSEVSRSALLEVLGAGQLRFEQVDRLEYRVRVYGITAIITGRTEMEGRLGEQVFQAGSRYTHVFVEEGDHWRMVAAQGTQIAASQ